MLSPGHQDGATWHGNVYLKGFGDPTLTSRELQRLAAQLKTAGIRRIDGRVVGDESWFDSRRTAPGWKSSFFLYESPPLSALVVDRGVYGGTSSLNPALAAAGRFKQLLRARGIVAGRASVGRAPADAYPLAEVESAALPRVAARDGSRQRQLHRRADVEATRRRDGAGGHDRRGCRGRRCAISLPRAFRWPACASPTAPGSRSTTG